LGHHASAVTASTLGFTAVNPNFNFTGGESGGQRAVGADLRTKDRIVFFIEALKDRSLAGSQIRVLAGAVFGLWQPHDEQVWLGAEAVTKYWGYPLKTSKRAIEVLRKKELLLLKKKGGGRGNSNKYLLGKTGTSKSPFELNGDTQVHKQGQRRPSHTFTKPKYTHTKELPSALNEETWKSYCLELNPERDPADISRTLDKAIRKGARDGFWKHLCRDFNSYYKTPPKPQAPAAVIARKAFSPAKLPPVKSSCESPRIGGLAFDGLSKEEWHAKENKWYGLGSRENWIKAECPHLTLNPEKHRIVAELIAKHALQIA
jgi:hypothetical protein